MTDPNKHRQADAPHPVPERREKSGHRAYEEMMAGSRLVTHQEKYSTDVGNLLGEHLNPHSPAPAPEHPIHQPRTNPDRPPQPHSPERFSTSERYSAAPEKKDPTKDAAHEKDKKEHGKDKKD